MRREEVTLRPLEERDLELLLSWRNSERVRGFMYTDHLIQPEEHRAWFNRTRQGEFPAALLFEFRGVPAGFKGFSQIDRANNRCHWGFYLGESDLPRGCASAMGFLALEYIFEAHGFHKVCAEAFAFNEPSIRYHARLGFRQEGLFLQHVLKGGRYEDIVAFGVLRDGWLSGKEALAKRIFDEDA